jgi:hypothetical protein
MPWIITLKEAANSGGVILFFVRARRECGLGPGLSSGRIRELLELG